MSFEMTAYEAMLLIRATTTALHTGRWTPIEREDLQAIRRALEVRFGLERVPESSKPVGMGMRQVWGTIWESPDGGAA